MGGSGGPGRRPVPDGSRSGGDERLDLAVGRGLRHDGDHDPGRDCALCAGDGWIDDDIAFIQPWGFNLSEISVPVLIWQGDQDLMVPHAHSYWLEKHIPTSKLNFVPGHGHISLIVKYADQILDQAQELLK